MNSVKAPPVFEEDSNYELYKKEVKIWEILIGDDLKAEQMGPALFKAIKSQKAKEKVLEIEIDVIGGVNGVKEILKKMDELYEMERDQKIYRALDEFENFKREKTTEVAEFVNKFEAKHNTIKKFECVLPDGVLAYKLLKAANLDQNQEQLCRATMSEWSYKEMIKQLKRVFNDVKVRDPKDNLAIKTEPIHLAEGMSQMNFHDEWYPDESQFRDDYLEGPEMNETADGDQAEATFYSQRNYNRGNPTNSRFPTRPPY